MQPTFDTIKRHYRRAERAIKRCDSLADAVPTPAINQLRYAGYHILVAISADKCLLCVLGSEKIRLFSLNWRM